MAAAAALSFLPLLACSADDPIKRPNGDEDAGPVEELDPPEMPELPATTPLTTIAARGTTEGSRVVTQGSPQGTLVTVVLPGGNFCRDVPIATDGPTTLRFYSLNGDGRVSTALEHQVTHDPAAPMPARGRCDGGVDPNIDCDDEEVCNSDGGDEDCNGYADQCDTACNGCQDDAYEPNDFPSNVPSLNPGTYPMMLCPCRDDWFAFNVNMGTRIRAAADFVHADIDIDIRLYRAGPEGQGVGDQVATSAGTTDREEVDYVADMPGAYYLRIFPFRDANDISGSYSLTIY